MHVMLEPSQPDLNCASGTSGNAFLYGLRQDFVWQLCKEQVAVMESDHICSFYHISLTSLYTVRYHGIVPVIIVLSMNC